MAGWPAPVPELLRATVAAHAEGRLAESLDLARQALALAPEAAMTHTVLGLLLEDSGDTAGAEASYRAALDCDAGAVNPLFRLTRLLRSRGTLDAAEALARRLLLAAPGHADGHNELGAILQLDGRDAEAIDCYRAAVRLDPGFAEAWKNLGVLLLEAGDLAGAEQASRTALAIDPAFAEARNTVGLVLKLRARLAEAEAEYRRALADRPDLPDPRFNLSLLLLLRGELTDGFAAFEARWGSRGFHSVRRQFPLPRWDGRPQPGRGLLVWGEQGIGDELMFAPLVRDAAGTGMRVVLEADPRLAGLLERALADPAGQVTVVPRLDPPHPATAAPDLVAEIPCGSLAGLFRRRLADFPAEPLRVTPCPARVAALRPQLAACGPGLRVGLCWTSRLRTARRDMNYLPLAAFAPLIALPGVVAISLQYNQAEVEPDILAFEAATGHRLHRFPDLDLQDDLETAAALTSQLDLVVSVASSVGEMAAALGIPTWRVSGPVDWSMLGTGVRPWWPAMRILAGSGAHGAPMADLVRLLRSLLPASVTQSAGHALLAAGDWAGAAAAFRREVAADPAAAYPLIGLAQALERLGRVSDAAACRRRAEQLAGRTG